ncbi:MAG: hypothetical protein IJT43_03875 [Stomatobaculum sp.]|nr:hypothetical protein [Stomatobaculum sp.]
MKKMLGVFLFAAAFSAMTAGAAFAAGLGNWHQNDYGYWWQRVDGTYPVSSWKWIDGNGDGIAECYHFDNKGYMDCDTWINGFYVGEDGAWISGGYVQYRSVADGVDEVKAPATDYEKPAAVSSKLLGRYEMHTELTDFYVVIENDAYGESILTYQQSGFHEDGSRADLFYRFTLQETSSGHYVGDEWTYSGDMITFDWKPGMDYLDNVRLNGAGLSKFYKSK